ncbi:Angiopoietin-related protein 4 [Labeo rohita]|uniref:Angiopoietin-related protein 4 n=1 Tax=Labeo rohita TaxID=84645 RepID=A0ABQ8MXI2_LABRO|nr:Angiopoietin-related protein 4 [Labeo rohita]
MKVPLANLLCITVLASSGTSFPLEKRGAATGKEKRVQYAAWDDVNVLAHGLLQLGQGLKEHVDKTKGQVRDITIKMKVFNVTISELSKLTQRLQEDSEALKAKAQSFEERENLVLNVSMDLREKTEQLLKDRKKDHERMNKLEEKVDGLMQGEGNYSDARTIQILMKSERSSLKRKEDDVHLNASSEQRDSPVAMASDCHELFLRGETTSGLYTIQPADSEPFEVFCEMTPEGGWTVIQRRQDGSVDFDQLWQAYQTGFGSLNGEFWLGLEKIHSVSKGGNHILKVQFSDWMDEVQSINYPFRLNGEESNYSLRILGSPAGNLESSLSTETSAVPFSTRDKDNDQKNDLNCAKQLSGGWWFSNCGRSNLNGRYFVTPAPKQRHQRKQGVFWKTWRGRYYPLKTTTMMIAPAEIENKS